jgi:hypothetical protein
MKLKTLIIAAWITAMIFPITSFAKESPAFPKSLFDVKLGGVYKIGKGRTPYDVGSLPVTRFTAIQRYLGSGLHYFFMPMREHENFGYIERRYDMNDEYFESSFRLYLLPVIKNSVTLKSQLEDIEWDWAVMLIEWSSMAERSEDAYYWARDLCSSKRMDLQRVPSINDDVVSKEYYCTFREGDKKLEIKAAGGTKFYKLSRTQMAMDATNDAVDATFRKIRVNELATY